MEEAAVEVATVAKSVIRNLNLRWNSDTDLAGIDG
jgi:hypothetical protein